MTDAASNKVQNVLHLPDSQFFREIRIPNKYITHSTVHTGSQNKAEQMDSQGIISHIMTPHNMISALLKCSTRTLPFAYQTTRCHNKDGIDVLLRESENQINKTFYFVKKTCSVTHPTDFTFNLHIRPTQRFPGP
jgi:hypothetical protein